MTQLSKRLSLAVALVALVLTSVPLRAQVVRDGVNQSATPMDDFWFSSSAGWFYTPTTSFQLAGIYTQFLAEGGSDRDVTIELLTKPLVDGGTLLASGVFNTSVARGQFGGVIFASAVDLTAGTEYFIGFRNLALPDAGDFDLVPESELLRVNYTDDLNATSLGASRYGFDDTESGLEGTEPYELELTEGPFTQPLLQLLGPSSVSAVPEPTTGVLLATGLAMLLIVSARRRRRA